jgi:hypothetical protein
MIARTITVCVLAVALLAFGTTGAQEEGNLVQAITVKVRPGTNAKFEEFVRAFRDASQQQGLENYWLSAESASGQPAYTFNMTMSGWGDMANPGPQLIEAFGEEEAMRIEGLLESSVEEMHVAFYETQPDLSVLPTEAMDTPPVAVLYSLITLNPGMAPQYIEATRMTREASLAVVPDSYYVVQAPGFGANGVRVIGIIQEWGDLDTNMGPGQRVIAHYGEEEGAHISQMATESISNIETTLYRTRPDLSYQPED